jgi:hypothetical protein
MYYWMFLIIQPGYQLVCSIVDILVTPIKTKNPQTNVACWKTWQIYGHITKSRALSHAGDCEFLLYIREKRIGTHADGRILACENEWWRQNDNINSWQPMRWSSMQPEGQLGIFWFEEREEGWIFGILMSNVFTYL